MAGQKKQDVHAFSRPNAVLNNTGSSATPHSCAPYIPLLITYCCTLHTASNYILLHTICHCTLHTTARYCALHTLHTPVHYILTTAYIHCALHTTAHYTYYCRLQGSRGSWSREEKPNRDQAQPTNSRRWSGRRSSRRSPRQQSNLRRRLGGGHFLGGAPSS